jgi:hypothetical protein
MGGRIAEGAIDLELLDLAVGECQQQLAGGTDTEGKRPSQLDERAKLVVALDGSDADSRVVVAHVEVHALAELVAEAPHRLVGHRPDIEGICSRFAPIQQPRAERISPVLRAPDDPERCQLIQQSVG